MTAHPVHIRLALFAGIALLVGGPAGALQLQMLGGAPEYFRTGDAYSSDEQRMQAEQKFNDDLRPHLPPASAFDGGYKRFANGVGFAPQMDFFPGGSGGFTPAAFRSAPPPPAGPQPDVEQLLADLPQIGDPDPQDPPPVVFSDIPAPSIEGDAPAPVPLPPALPLFASVIGGLLLLPNRRRA